jgi:hypothetical protein
MTTTVRDTLNRSNANTLADKLAALGFGDILGGDIPITLRQQTPTANDSGAPISTTQQIKLPNNMKACQILRATSRAGTAGGQLVVDTALSNSAPASGHISVQPNGDLALLTSDGMTGVDVTIVPERGDVVVLENVDVASDVYTFPAALTARGVVTLISAVSVAGTLTGNLRVLLPVTAAPATTKAQLDLAKSMVQFAVADAVTKATLTLLVAAEVSLADALAAAATTL